MSHNHPFESHLEVSPELLDSLVYGFGAIEWLGYLLNPRRLRGSDFLMRWSQGVWSEQRIIEAVNRSKDYFALPYGPSGVAPTSGPREFELYFERLEKAGLGKIKRPDLLVFRARDHAIVKQAIDSVGGPGELPFTPEAALAPLLQLAVVAIECENSLWRAERMPAYNKPLTLQRRTGKLGMPKTAVVPTIIVKEEDRGPLRDWASANGVPIHIWHLFFDHAYGIAFTEIERLIESGQIEPTRQVYQAPGGATSAKIIYKIYYQLGYEIGAAHSEPSLVPDCIEDKNGHILPFVRFAGGSMELATEAVAALRALESVRS